MSIREVQVTALSVFAGVAWTVGGVIIVAGMFYDLNGLPGLGLWISGWGGVATMARCYEHHAVAREQAAFDLGRRVGEKDNVSRL